MRAVDIVGENIQIAHGVRRPEIIDPEANLQGLFIWKTYGIIFPCRLCFPLVFLRGWLQRFVCLQPF